MLKTIKYLNFIQSDIDKQRSLIMHNTAIQMQFLRSCMHIPAGIHIIVFQDDNYVVYMYGHKLQNNKIYK